MTEIPVFHKGLAASTWDALNNEEQEIAFFQRLIEEHGTPALDAGCGTGRLLLPYLRAGLDVDGSDIAGDMLERCRDKARQEGLTPTLYEQPMHALDLPRRYRTIFLCGSLGIGTTREQDEEALRRLYQHLEPGGFIALDQQAPWHNTETWRFSQPEQQAHLPTPWRVVHTRTHKGQRFLRLNKTLRVDPLEQVKVKQVRFEVWQDDTLVEQEEYTFQERWYFKAELCQMLEKVGFHNITILGDYTEATASAEHHFLIFIAHKPGS